MGRESSHQPEAKRGERTAYKITKNNKRRRRRRKGKIKGYLSTRAREPRNLLQLCLFFSFLFSKHLGQNTQYIYIYIYIITGESTFHERSLEFARGGERSVPMGIQFCIKEGRGGEKEGSDRQRRHVGYVQAT